MRKNVSTLRRSYSDIIELLSIALAPSHGYILKVELGAWGSRSPHRDLWFVHFYRPVQWYIVLYIKRSAWEIVTKISNNNGALPVLESMDVNSQVGEHLQGNISTQFTIGVCSQTNLNEEIPQCEEIVDTCVITLRRSVVESSLWLIWEFREVVSNSIFGPISA